VALLARAVGEAWQELQCLAVTVAKVTASPRASPPRRPPATR